MKKRLGTEVRKAERSEKKYYEEDLKKNAINLSYASPKTVKALPDDLEFHENLLHKWRRTYMVDGDKTKHATLAEENRIKR